MSEKLYNFEQIANKFFNKHIKSSDSGMPSKKFNKFRFPYVVTKPLHPSQVELDRENCIIQLNVFLTPELESLIFSYGDHVEVLEPASLRETFRQKIKLLTEKYNCAE